MSYDNITLDLDENVAIVTFNRPSVLNALNNALLIELIEIVEELQDNDKISAIVLTGKGQRAFSAGGDIHEMARIAEMEKPPPQDPRRLNYPWHIARCSKPMIGAINGLAYGGGALIASSLDIRVGCSNTSFRFLAATYGQVNSTWSLPMQVGWPVAKELLFTGRVVESDEAYRIGLLNHLVKPEELMSKSMQIAKMIAESDDRMVQGIKQLLMDDIGASWQKMYDNEIEAQSDKLKPTPVKEGFKEFLKRKGTRDSCS